MTKLIDFEDAVTAANLDPNQKHAVYYMDGHFANHDTVAAQCPHAKLYGITVTGLTGPDVFACDCEAGDLSVASAVTWVAEQVRLNVRLIVVYASLDTWLNQGLKAQLAPYGHRIRRWVAHFDDVRQIEDWADAEQYATGSIDRDVALANFFGDELPPVKPKTPYQRMHYERYDGLVRENCGNTIERWVAQRYDKLRAEQTRFRHPHRKELASLRHSLALHRDRVGTLMVQDAPAGKKLETKKDYYGWRYYRLDRRVKGDTVHPDAS